MEIPSSSTAARLFQIGRKSFARHYDAVTTTAAGTSRPFYVEMSSFTPNKPDLILREGTSDKGAIVAVCHIPALSKSTKIGLGNPDAKPDAVRWEEMNRESLAESAFRWETSFAGGGRSGRRTLVWKRTHSVGVTGQSPSKFTMRNWKLVAAEGGGEDDVLAVFTSDRTLSNCGTLEIRAAFGEEFDMMVLITCLALYESARRRKNRAGKHGGGS